MLADVAKRNTAVWRHLLPWIISALALGYVFGFAIEWHSIPQATANADLTSFVLITIADKLAFFLAWAFIQAKAIRVFVEPVSIRALLSVKGAAELLRTGSNLLSDGAFLFGVSQLVRDRLSTFLAIIIIPFGAHFFVLLCQTTIALPFLEGGAAQNIDVAIAALVGWSCALASLIALRLGYWSRLLQRVVLGVWSRRA